MDKLILPNDGNVASLEIERLKREQHEERLKRETPQPVTEPRPELEAIAHVSRATVELLSVTTEAPVIMLLVGGKSSTADFAGSVHIEACCVKHLIAARDVLNAAIKRRLNGEGEAT